MTSMLCPTLSIDGNKVVHVALSIETHGGT